MGGNRNSSKVDIVIREIKRKPRSYQSCVYYFCSSSSQDKSLTLGLESWSVSCWAQSLFKEAHQWVQRRMHCKQQQHLSFLRIPLEMHFSSLFSCSDVSSRMAGTKRQQWQQYVELESPDWATDFTRMEKNCQDLFTILIFS